MKQILSRDLDHGNSEKPPTKIENAPVNQYGIIAMKW